MINKYEFLRLAYDRAVSVCDPIDFACRQKGLVYAIANYLLERDKPQEEIEAEEEKQEQITEALDKMMGKKDDSDPEDKQFSGRP